MKKLKRKEDYNDENVLNHEKQKSFFETKQAREIIILSKLCKSNSLAKNYIVEFIDFFFVKIDPNHYFLVLELCEVLIIILFLIYIMNILILQNRLILDKN